MRCCKKVYVRLDRTGRGQDGGVKKSGVEVDEMFWTELGQEQLTHIAHNVSDLQGQLNQSQALEVISLRGAQIGNTHTDVQKHTHTLMPDFFPDGGLI